MLLLSTRLGYDQIRCCIDMDFLQRRSHLFRWIVISMTLLMGYGFSAYYIFRQAPHTQPEQAIPFFGEDSSTMDSIYHETLMTSFVLRTRGPEKYIEAKVSAPLPVTSLKVYKGNKMLGIIDSKGTHILGTDGNTIGELHFIDAITGEKF